MPMVDLQALHDVLDIHQPARAVFGVQGAARHQMPDLPLAHGAHGGHIERLATIDESVAQGHDLLSQGNVAGDGAQFDQRLALVSPRLPFGSEIAAKSLKRDSHAARLAVGAQLQIHLKDTLPLGPDGCNEGLHQPLIELRIGDHVGAARLPIAGEYEHQLDVRRESQLPPTAFAQGTDTHGAGVAICQHGKAVAGLQLLLTQVIGRFHHHLSQIGQLGRELPELGNVAQDMPHIHPEHLPVLESVERVTPGRIVRGRRQGRPQRRPQFLLRSSGGQFVHIAHDGNQVGILHAQEVVPQKLAHTQQAGQRIQHLVSFQRSQFIRPVRTREQFAQELAKVQQRRFGIGRQGQQVGKMFDQDGGSPQFPLFLRCRDLLSPLVGDVQDVFHPVADRVDRHLGDVDVVDCQRVGKLIEEADRIGRVDFQHGVSVGKSVVDLDVHRVKRRRRPPYGPHDRCHPFGQLAPGLATLPPVHQAQQFGQVVPVA